MSIFMVGTEDGTTGKEVHRMYLLKDGTVDTPDPAFATLPQNVVEVIKASTQRAIAEGWSMEDYDRHCGKGLSALQGLTKVKPKGAKIIKKATVLE